MTDASRGARPVRFAFERLVRGTANGAADPRHADRTLQVLVGSGRACALHGAGMQTVLVPLRGHLTLTENDSTRIVQTGGLFVSEGGSHLQIIGSGEALWIALVAPAGVWRQLVHAISEQPIPAPVLLPAVHAVDRTIRRAIARLASEVRNDAASGETECAVLRFMALLLDLQAALDAFVGRCPGRTLGQRRGVFLRLQRACTYIESSNEPDLGIAGLARVANYSPSHFLRTFNSVYGKTPYAVLIEQRLRRARRLVYSTTLSIAEVARASGFENRCAFARSFKRRFGETARDCRLAGAGVSE